MAGSSEEEEKIRRHMVVSSAGYCYSDLTTENPNHAINPGHIASHELQSFESNTEIYNLTTGMELIGFPPKINHHHHHHHHQPSEHDPNSVFWKGPSSSCSSKTVADPSDFYPYDQNRMAIDESSLRCVFPCEANERPSQGLSLSLSSSNPSTSGLQHFELRQQEGYFGKSVGMQQNQDILQDGFLGKVGSGSHYHESPQFQIRSSKYLIPTQELLNEFCNLGTRQNNDPSTKMKTQKSNQWQEDTTASSSSKQSLHSLEFLELQRRKAKLLQILDEVDRRYRHYRDQMQAVVSSFEAVAGDGAATVYSALASRAMSRHFRCLRDGIVGQIKATNKAMGEKDNVAPGLTRGETPRLRLLDQTLRQQKVLQQMNMMESHPWRPQRGLPERSVSLLRAWLFEHFLHPYPSDVDKHLLARQTGLSKSQVSNWFINARVRLWKPMVEEMYTEETKDQEQDNAEGSSDVFASLEQESLVRLAPNPRTQPEDQKPTLEELVRIDSECLSSIINNPDASKGGTPRPVRAEFHPGFARVHESFGAVELDFSSYNSDHLSPGALTFESQGFGGSRGGGGVSLTLGLQQHGGGGNGSGVGVSLAFSPTSRNSLFYPPDHIEDCQTIQYSLLDGEGQNLPYRNLMGSQLLDFAG